MSRADRWWRPAPRRNVRPAVRANRRGRHAAGQDVGDVFEIGYEAGRADEAKRSRDRDEQLRRLDEACDAAEQGDMSLLDAFVDGDQASGDDLLDVADVTGVTPLADAGFEDELVPEIEAWLRGRDGDG